MHRSDRAPVDKYNYFLVLCILAYLTVSYFFLEKSMFSLETADGFYQQMRSVADGDMDWDSPLALVHYFRYLVVWPFYWIWLNDYPPILESVLLVVFMLPILRARFGGRAHMAQALFVFMPLVLSSRSVLAACSVAYLFILLFTERRSLLLFVTSGLLANLSSGVVLDWILILSFNARALFDKHRTTPLLWFAMVYGLALSSTHKLEFFSGAEKYGGSSLSESLMRSTLVVSFIEGQHVRFFVYASVAILVLAVITYSVFQRRVPFKVTAFFLTSVPGFFFEGLTVMAYIIPLIWYYLGVLPASAANATAVPDEPESPPEDEKAPWQPRQA